VNARIRVEVAIPRDGGAPLGGHFTKLYFRGAPRSDSNALADRGSRDVLSDNILFNAGSHFRGNNDLNGLARTAGLVWRAGLLRTRLLEPGFTLPGGGVCATASEAANMLAVASHPVSKIGEARRERDQAGDDMSNEVPESAICLMDFNRYLVKNSPYPVWYVHLRDSRTGTGPLATNIQEARMKTTLISICMAVFWAGSMVWWSADFSPVNIAIFGVLGLAFGFAWTWFMKWMGYPAT
jgi:hypothetical protein